MSHAELDEAVTAFIETIRDALGEAPTSSYATTVLTIGPSGDLCFELLYLDGAPAEMDRATFAFEFGKTLGRDQQSVAAVIVGEEMVGEPDVPWLVVTAATAEGERRTACMKMSRLPDGSLQIPRNQRPAFANSNELECHLASQVMKGILFQGEPV